MAEPGQSLAIETIMKMHSDMRRFVSSILVVATIVLSSTSCRNEQMPDTPQESVKRITVQASQAETRTAVIADGQDYKPTWKAGDWIKLFEFSDEGVIEGYSEDLTEDTPLLASFNVEFEDNQQGSPLQYVGAYSGNTQLVSVDDPDLGGLWAQAWGNNSAVPRWWLDGYIPENQRPRLDSFDPEADVMFSRMTEKETRPNENETIDLAFARVGSIAKITLKDLPAGERVISGYWTVGGSWQAWGDVLYDYTKGKIAIVPPESNGVDTDGILPDGMINFFFDGDVVPVVGEDRKVVIWLRVLSGELSDHFSISVETEDSSGQKHEYKKEVDLASKGRSIIFDEGGITEFTVGMDAVDPGTPTEPNIHDYITFSEETLMYFPELASDHPVIRIPRKEFDMSFEWYRFSYSDDIPSVELDGGNGAYGARFIDEDNPNASWEDTWLFVGWNSSRGMCIYPRSRSNWLRSGKMVFSTNETYQNGYPTFEVPVEEYYVPTLKKNGIPVHNNESLMMYPGEAPAVITVEIPKWMTVESHYWTIYDQDGIASFSDETDDSDEYYTRYSRTVSIDPTLPYGSCRVVFISYLSYEHMTSVGIQQMGYSVDCGINIFPFHIYDQNENNLTSSYLYLKRGDRLTLEPRFYGISADQIEDVMWYDDSGWYEVPGTDEWEYDPERSILNLSYNSAAPYKAEITVKDNAEGEGHVSCWVKLVGEEDYNWDVSLSIYLKNSSATVSHAPSVPKYTATKDRPLSKHSPLILK